MVTALYPGSFDPVTTGHLDVIKRASKMFDKLYVGILKNSSKNPIFSIDERVSMMRDEVKDMDNVEVVSFDGLVIQAAKDLNAGVLVRGLRAVTDFEYEIQMAHLNRSMAGELDTVFLATELEYTYLSSSVVKEVAYYNGDISHLVTPNVQRLMKEKMEAYRAQGN